MISDKSLVPGAVIGPEESILTQHGHSHGRSPSGVGEEPAGSDCSSEAGGTVDVQLSPRQCVLAGFCPAVPRDDDAP
jgi:hypothetical protein